MSSQNTGAPRSISLGRVRQASAFARDGIEEFFGCKVAAARPEAPAGLAVAAAIVAPVTTAANAAHADTGPTATLPAQATRTGAATSVGGKSPCATGGLSPATFGGISPAAFARLRRLGFSGRKTATPTRDGFEEFFGYEEANTSPLACGGRSPAVGGKSPAAGLSVPGGISPASSLNRLRKMSLNVYTTSNKTRDGFEEFFGYEEAACSPKSPAGCRSPAGVISSARARLPAMEAPSLLRGRFSYGPAIKKLDGEKPDIIVIRKESLQKPVQAEGPQVMDATEASLSMVRSEIEDRKELLKQKPSGEEFDQICLEIQQLKSQQARLAGALWEAQPQQDCEGFGTEMQLKAWLCTDPIEA